MKLSSVSIDRRKTEAEAVLNGFITIKIQKYGYGYPVGYLESTLTRILSRHVSEEVYDSILNQLRDATTDSFVNNSKGA